MFHQSQFGYNTDRKRLACATNNVLELWDYKPETLTLHKRLLVAPIIISSIQAQTVCMRKVIILMPNWERRRAVSNNYVYVLYNPNTNRMHEEQRNS